MTIYFIFKYIECTRINLLCEKSQKVYIINFVVIRWKLRILLRKFKKERFEAKMEFEVKI